MSQQTILTEVPKGRILFRFDKNISFYLLQKHVYAGQMPLKYDNIKIRYAILDRHYRFGRVKLIESERRG